MAEESKIEVVPAATAVAEDDPETTAAESAPTTVTGQARAGLKKILSDFVVGTKDLLHFVFVEERAERRQELVESMRFYVTYK